MLLWEAWIQCVASFVQYKMWLKPNAEQTFLYGNHVLKSGLSRVTENVPQYQGVVIYSMSDMPLVRECKHTHAPYQICHVPVHAHQALPMPTHNASHTAYCTRIVDS